MKHSSDGISGIKMSSNVNDEMEWNDVLFERNNLTYYTHETETRVQSCDAMKMQQN